MGPALTSVAASNRADRRRGIRLTYLNALLWALGNGLASTTLVIFLALELGAQGVALSWIVASPKFAGMMRLVTPSLIAWLAKQGWQGRKLVCLCGYFLSTIALIFVPISAMGVGTWDHGGGLVILILAWCLYHLLEYTGTIAYWSWLGDLYPRPLASRLIGRREGFLTFGRVLGIGLSLMLATTWNFVVDKEAARWIPLAASAAVGAGLMLLSAIPLLWVPAMSNRSSAVPEAPWKTLAKALTERAYRRLLTYSCALSFANGITGTAQSLYVKNVLGIQYNQMIALRAMLYGGQTIIAPLSGGWIARWGAKPVMFVSQLIVATGPLFYYYAKPGPAEWAPWVVAGAFVVWMFYAPLNVGADILKLTVADSKNNSPYLSVFFATSQLVNGVTILIGGYFYDKLNQRNENSLELFAWFFLVGWLLRTLTALLILRFEERQA